jgi:SpoIIAA-like
MIRTIPHMPTGTIGFEATGKVSQEDYETVLVPAVQAAMEAGRVRILYVLGDDFESYAPGAMWADTRLWAGNLRGWEKIAIATDIDWIENAIKAFRWMMPGKVRLFDDDEVDEAQLWLARED